MCCILNYATCTMYVNKRHSITFFLFSDKYQENQLRESSNDKEIVIEDLEEKRQDKEQKWEETICKP